MPRKSKHYNERIEIGRTADGKRIRKWIRADTKAELEAMRRQAYRDTEQARNPSAVTYQDYAQIWLNTYKADITNSTRLMYDSLFRRFESINKRPISSITATDLQQIINGYRQYPTACRKIKTTAKGIFRAAIRDGIYAGDNPAADLILPKKPKTEKRIITDEEMVKILSADFTPKEKLYVDVERYTGMRPSEALTLSWEDINYKDRCIHVSHSIDYGLSESHIKDTKTGVERDIPLNSSLASTLKLEGKKSGFIFLDDGVLPTKKDYIKFSTDIAKKIDRAVGYKGITLYSFRHTFATFLFYKGVRTGKISTKKAAQIMGHSEKLYISAYTHIDDSQEQALEIIDELE